MNVYRTTLMIVLNILIILLLSYTVIREISIQQTVHSFIIYLYIIMIAWVCIALYFTIRARIIILREAANPNPEPIGPAEMEARIQMMNRIKQFRKYAFLIVILGTLLVITVSTFYY